MENINAQEYIPTHANKRNLLISGSKIFSHLVFKFTDPMTTVIYQSFREDDVPEWIAQCMTKVRLWAKSKGYEYRFYNDDIFDLVPDWYRNKINMQIHLVMDLARLVAAKELLEEGFKKAIWIDADVLIVDEDNFNPNSFEQYAFSKEVFLTPMEPKRLQIQNNTNNAVMGLEKDNHLLDFYIDSCQNIVKTLPNLNHTSVGTDFLSSLNNFLPMAKYQDIALFCPIMNKAVVHKNTEILKFYASHFQNRICAINLCATYIDSDYYGIDMTNQIYQQSIKTLEIDKGKIINQYIGT